MAADGAGSVKRLRALAMVGALAALTACGCGPANGDAALAVKFTLVRSGEDYVIVRRTNGECLSLHVVHGLFSGTTARAAVLPKGACEVQP